MIRILQFFAMVLCGAAASLAAERLNVVLLTVDDMNCDSIGVYGCPVPEVTPNIDAFAAESMRFDHAHVHATSCIPSRNAMQSGRYLFNSGIEGFYQLPKEAVDFQTIPDLLRANGYFTMIRGKSKHSSPYYPYPAWDVNFDDVLKEKKENIRHPETFYRYTKEGVIAAKKANKPFFYCMDIHDPHTGLYNWDNKTGTQKLGAQDKNNPPSRIYTVDEITVPTYLPDTPLVRQEIAAYYSSVRRADDSFGQVVRALKETGAYENTLFIFLSDHGMPFPFAKTAMYYHSTRTPLTIRWPGVTKKGAVDREHVVGTVDLLPTICEAVGIPAPDGIDGRSLASILKGGSQSDRDHVYVMYEENVGGNRQPTRAIVTKKHAYIANLWSDGTRKFASATNGMAARREMRRLADAGDKAMQVRNQLLDYRVPEELFDYSKDPDALDNLIDNPEYNGVLSDLQEKMVAVMKRSNDPTLVVYQQRAEENVVQGYLAELDKASKARKADVRYARSGKVKTSKKIKKKKRK